MNKFKSGCIAATLSLATTNVMAVVIDFEGITNSQTTETYSTMTFSGFDVYVPHGHYEDSSLRSLGGSDYLTVDHYSSWQNMGFDLSANNGSAFSLQSIDVSEWEAFNSNTILTVTAQLFGGGTLTTQFTTDATLGFETLVFGSDWDNLLSVNFTDFTYDNNSEYGLLAFDNIVVNESRSVPEPATLALLGLGLLGMGMTRKKK